MPGDDVTSVPLTPELALVDPELAARARALLPDAPDCLVLQPFPPARERVPARRRREPRRTDTTRRSGRWALAAAWAAAATLVGSSFLAFIGPAETTLSPAIEPDRPRKATTPGGARSVERGGRVTGAGRPEKPTKVVSPSVAGQPMSAKPVKRGTGVLLRWKPARKAALYNLVILAGGKRVDAWPKRNVYRFEPPVSLRPPKGGSLAVEWFVYPAFEGGEGFRYGPLLARGSARIPR